MHKWFFPRLDPTAPELYKTVRRLIILVIGLSVLLFGIAMIFLPGPALIVIPLALALLGTEFLWARQILNRFKKETKKIQEMFIGKKK